MKNQTRKSCARKTRVFGNLASAGAAAGSVNEDAVLAVLAKIAINGRDLLDSRLQAPWLRVLGEIHYAQANYAVSSKGYFAIKCRSCRFRNVPCTFSTKQAQCLLYSTVYVTLHHCLMPKAGFFSALCGDPSILKMPEIEFFALRF